MLGGQTKVSPAAADLSIHGPPPPPPASPSRVSVFQQMTAGSNSTPSYPHLHRYSNNLCWIFISILGVKTMKVLRQDKLFWGISVFWPETLQKLTGLHFKQIISGPLQGTGFCTSIKFGLSVTVTFFAFRGQNKNKNCMFDRQSQAAFQRISNL